MAKSQFLLFLLLFLFLTHQSLQQQQQQISAVDLAVLHAIRSSLSDLPRSHFFSTWDFAAPNPCSTFAGLLCSPDPSATATPLLRVTSLTLGTGLAYSPGLVGSLTPSLSNLTALTQLVLNAGIVSGSIPPQLGNLKSLRVISLTNNRLSGPIPYSLSTLPNLHTLDLSGNQLGGSVPPSLTRLPSLKVLILASNRLSGNLANVPTQLLHLDLKNNRLSGELPSLPLSLRYLSLSENEMCGPLNVIVPLAESELVYLDLSINQFNGSIPESLLRPTLSSLLLQRNNLSGGVPRRVAVDATLYGAGSIVDLSHNVLSGELSPVLARVESLFLNNNRLIGIVPDEYVRSVSEGSMKTLYLQHNYLSGFPLEAGSPLPDSASLCLMYNCMVPPVGTMTCPASAGGLFSRPAYQCR